MNTERIVVGVDDSAGARTALQWALREAKLRGTTLRVVHVWSMSFAWAMGVRPSVVPDPQQVTAAANQMLGRMIADAQRATDDGVPVEPVVAEGNPAEVLLEAAKGAAMLVVGSRGRGGFGGLRLGSVSQHCVQYAPCPVLVVPSPRD